MGDIAKLQFATAQILHTSNLGASLMRIADLRANQ